VDIVKEMREGEKVRMKKGGGNRVFERVGETKEKGT
jgi:hypothetical protein